MRTTVLALVDVVAMYASVERVCDLSLRGKPLVVLSNNDGACVSVSPEARAIGVRTGQRWFEVQADPALRAVVAARSSNYELIGDFSRRFVAALETVAPNASQYSVDEAFLELPRTDSEMLAWLAKDRVDELVGLPVRVGVGETRTLAKLANKEAKHPYWRGVLDLTTLAPQRLDRRLAELPAGEIWGVGAANARKLAARGIRTALDLKRLDPRAARRIGTVNLERTVRELNGTRCLFGEDPEERHEVMVSRMFGKAVTTAGEMAAAAGDRADQAAARLRKKRLDCAHVLVSMSTSPYSPGPPRSVSLGSTLPSPTDRGDELAFTARSLARALFQPGYRYARCAVMLADLAPAGERAVFGSPDRLPASVWGAVDAVRAKHGRRAVRLGHGPRAWEARSDMLSPCWTTRIRDLPVAQAD